MKSRIVCILFGIICTYVVFNRDQFNKPYFFWDKFGYHAYLPATFIYNDLSHLSFYPEIINKYEPFGTHKTWHMVVDCTDNRKLNKYPPGVSLSNLPLFICAHLYASSTDKYPADGYSAPYALANIMSSIIWVMIGLFVLRALLRRYFSDTATAITILCIGLGTNLYHYSTFDQGMSHTFCFFLFSVVLLYTDKWYRSQKLKHIIILSATLGLLFLTRAVDLMAGLIPVFWGLYNFRSVRERLATWMKYRKHLVLGLIVLLALASVNFIYTKWISGNWYVDTYSGESFNFLKPKICLGLFSYQKGWFIYTPVAFIALVGFYFLWKRSRELVPGLVAFLAIAIYIIFSWKQWHYGGSFGARAMIDILPVLSLPLCALTEAVIQKRRVWFSAPFFVILSACITLNMFQSYQFSKGILHWNNMNKKYYWHIFGKTEVGPDDWHMLMTDEEVRKTEE